MIRYLGGLGQSSDPGGPSYHPNGLPLVEGLVEIVTEETSAPGERHAHLAEQIGKTAIFCWAGEPEDSENEVGGVDWILAGNWMPYQRSTFVTPAFAAYVSGHSTFSRAGAEVMTLLTGSPYFPGGIGEFHFEAGEYLEFENGPSEDMVLQWATYYDAADQAGISRLYGGIHVSADDVKGRILGAHVGLEAFLKMNYLGGVTQQNVGMTNLRSRQFLDSDGRLITSRVKYSDRSTNLPVRRLNADGTSESGPNDLEPGMYFTVFEDGSGMIDTYLVGEQLHGYACDGEISADIKQLSVMFELPENQTATVLIRGIRESALGSGDESLVEDPLLILYRISEGGEEVLIDENDDWFDHDLDSLTQVIATRENLTGLSSESKAAALVTQLSKGKYKAVIESRDGDAGLATIEITLPILAEQ